MRLTPTYAPIVSMGVNETSPYIKRRTISNTQHHRTQQGSSVNALAGSLRADLRQALHGDSAILIQDLSPFFWSTYLCTTSSEAFNSSSVSFTDWPPSHHLYSAGVSLGIINSPVSVKYGFEAIYTLSYVLIQTSLVEIRFS
jgi:hypothetical protein